MPSKSPLIFAGRASSEFALALAHKLAVPLASSQALTFSDGNTFVQLLQDVHHQDVIIVQALAGANVDRDFLELAFYLDAAKRAGANRVTAVVPYFSYAKADKHDYPGTSLRARVCADALQTAGLTRIMMLDLHSPSIPGFFSVPVEHLTALPLISSYLKKLKLPQLVIVSPDAGFAKTARHYSAHLGKDCVICDKNRPDHSEKPDVLEIIGNVKDKNVVIVDDFTTSGGTLIEVSRALITAGAKTVRACVSHAPLTRPALEKIQRSPLTSLVTTNTIDGLKTLARAFPKLKVLDATPLFAAAY